MKFILTISLIFFQLIGFSQATDSLLTQTNTKSGVVSFTTKFDTVRLTKSGIYLNGYLVNISREQANELKGKKIRVSGKVTFVEGVKNLPGEDIKAGIEVDTKQILSPKIEIIKPQL